MSYFPIFIDLKNKDCLVVGGGKVSLRKAKTLLKYDAKVTVISPKVLEDFKSLKLKIIYKNFETSDLNNVFLVVTATNNIELNREILEICLKKNILCNSATDNLNNGYIFPSTIQKDDISIGISTSGKSPYVSRKIREDIEKTIPLDVYSNLIEKSSKLKDELSFKDLTQKDRETLIKNLIDESLQ